VRGGKSTHPDVQIGFQIERNFDVGKLSQPIMQLSTTVFPVSFFLSSGMKV
jgi:hypothetical protein